MKWKPSSVPSNQSFVKKKLKWQESLVSASKYNTWAPIYKQTYTFIVYTYLFYSSNH